MASLCEGFYWAVNFKAVCAEAPLCRGYLDSRSNWTPKLLPGPAPLQPHDPGFGSDPREIFNA